MASNRIKIVSVPVSNQDRAKAFYVEALGFELVADNAMDPDQRWLQVAPKGSATALTLVTWFPSMARGSMKGMVFETDDIEAAYGELSTRGVKFSSTIQTEFWGTFAPFDDPDGNGWVLAQSAPTA